LRTVRIGLVATMVAAVEPHGCVGPNVDWIVQSPLGARDVGGFCQNGSRAAFVIKNRGSEPAPASWARVEFQVGGAPVAFEVPPLAPGASSVPFEFLMPSSCLDPDCTFWIEANAGRLTESQPDNNRFMGRCSQVDSSLAPPSSRHEE
jgi:hypothetical protein